MCTSESVDTDTEYLQLSSEIGPESVGKKKNIPLITCV